MAKRYIGDAIIEIKYVGYINRRDDYTGKIKVKNITWKFDSLYAPAAGFNFAYDSPQAYDKMAQAAVSFGSYYTTHNRGDDLPDWAPPPEIADTISEATSWAVHDDGSYEILRKKS